MKCLIRQSAILLLLFISGSAYSQSKIGPTSNVSSLQTRQMSLGGCSINLVDGSSFSLNPGTMGVYYLDHYFSASISLGLELPAVDYTLWSASRDLDDWDVSGGLNIQKLFNKNQSKPKVSIAFGYMHSKDKLTRARVWPEYYPESEEIQESSNNYYAISIAFEHRIRFGFGYAINSPRWYYEDRYEVSTSNGDDTNDFGFYADLPISLGRLKYSPENKSVLSLWITPSFAFVRRHLNSVGSFGPDEETYLGWGMKFDLRKRNMNHLSLLMLLEYDKPDDYENYYWGYDYDYLQQYNFEWRHKFGIEISVLDAVFARIGKAEGIDDGTFGFGVSTRGIMDRLLHMKSNGKNDAANYILNNIDIRYEIGRSTLAYPYQWQTYHRISLVI